MIVGGRLNQHGGIGVVLDPGHTPLPPHPPPHPPPHLPLQENSWVWEDNWSGIRVIVRIY